MRTNIEVDRLSNLPDDLIHKILSFIGVKYAIRTSLLSLRWRFVWTSMPYLNFSVEDFRTMPRFYKFVPDVLSRRNNQIEVFSLKLSFRGKVNQVYVYRILHYAFSHNVQRLTLTCLNKGKSLLHPSLFTSRSLKCLTLTNSLLDCSITPASTWNLPALTKLHVNHVHWWDGNFDTCLDLFSTCVNLKNLTFSKLHVTGEGVFSIHHPRLSNLTLENVTSVQRAFNVVAPQLKNLTVKDCSMKCRISAPDLSYFYYEGYCPQGFSTDGFQSLEKVKLCFRYLSKEDAPRIVGLLQQVHSTKFLRLNSEIVELLSSSTEQLSHQPSPFANLKCLKIYPLDLNEELDTKMTMSTEVRNYLLHNSPNATITMVSRKEIMAPKNAKLAQKLMEEVQVLLEQRKANSETNEAHTKTRKADTQVQHKQGSAQVKLGGRMTEINSYWEGLKGQIEQGKTESCGILSKLARIEELLARMPEWQSAEMQPMFSHMCAEADTVMNDIIDSNFFHCDNKRRCVNAYFREIAITSQPSS